MRQAIGIAAMLRAELTEKDAAIKKLKALLLKAEQALDDAQNENDHTLMTAGTIAASMQMRIAELEQALALRGEPVALDIDAVLLATNRRDYLFSNAPPCVKCGTRQVQCVDYLVVPSQWKCRECKYKFALEPIYAAPISGERVIWHDGVPPKPYCNEWFMAETTFKDRVVLTALPEEYSYDFKTADETYIKADRIVRWAQFPDSDYIPHVSGERVREALEAQRYRFLRAMSYDRDTVPGDDWWAELADQIDDGFDYMVDKARAALPLTAIKGEQE